MKPIWPPPFADSFDLQDDEYDSKFHVVATCFISPASTIRNYRSPYEYARPTPRHSPRPSLTNSAI
ncbi:unnamed protein product [Citrullus colocynthis]|uniref:Uncharacterized protein n=1 Tax=Citrullus colocynthis TaxID=252529 RepID=A0ABP0YHG0_9ROSI